MSLPVFMWKHHRAAFSPARHVAVPALGASTLIVPFAELFQPGQPFPYSAFPFVALGVIAASALAAVIIVRRNPSAGSGEGAALRPAG
jgi:hypothetical protein